MKTAVFSTKVYDKDYLEKANAGRHELVFFESTLRPSSVRLAEGFDAVCAFVNDNLSAEVIEGLARLGIKLIVLRCAGFNHVDIEATSKYDIMVLRVPAYSPHAVAEHAVALITTLARKTHKAYNRVRDGNFSLERLIGYDLFGKTVGIIGTGRIGAALANIMMGFGCNIIAFDRYPNKELIGKGVKYMTQDEVFAQADIISLHCPLTPESHHMINRETLNQMKRGVMLINTSRGKLIDTEAAIEFLKDGHLGYLGIDVYEQEEKIFFKDLSEVVIRDDKISRLMNFPNVLITAHQAFLTDTALTQIALTTIENLNNYENETIEQANVVSLEMVR
ncbi:MAG: 2-hydroxyacid dehydrogenase [Bacteroidota bacterium]|nr:2-hydroxyacid dehydrogenase [Bacteroidota bacterium]